MLLILILYMLCASMFTISKWALSYAKPIFFMSVRMVFAGIILWLYCFIESKIKKKRINLDIYKDWFLFLQIIIFHIYITYICDLCALKNISSIESAFLYNLSPFISAFFSYFFFSEFMTPKKWVGLFIGFCSLIPGFIAEYKKGIILTSFTPKIVTFAAVVSSAYGWIVLRALVKERGYSAIFVNSVGMFFGGLCALVTSFFFENWLYSQVVTKWVPFIYSTIAIIVVANILFYNLYGYLLNKYTATFLSFAGFMCPLFAGLFGYLVLNEPLPVDFGLSFSLVSLGLYIFYQEELHQGYIK